MYQAHQTHWFAAGIVACLGLAVAFAVLMHFGKLKLPRYVFFLLLGGVFLQMAVISRLQASDEENFRLELRSVPPDAVSNLWLRGGAVNRTVNSTNEIVTLFNQLQRIQPVHAHHSSPLDPVELQFTVGGHEYRYNIARDSERAGEFWVLETARAGNPGREIGRIESSTLGALLTYSLPTQQPEKR